jgi:hypothetical protein
MRPYRLTIPQTPSELHDLLGSMMLESPEFTHPLFPGRNIDTTFEELSQGLRINRTSLGETAYDQLMASSQELRSLYEAKDVKAGNMVADRMSEIIEKHLR